MAITCDFQIMEFLMKKVYKETKEIKDLKKTEEKLQNLFNEEIVKVERNFASNKKNQGHGC